MSEVYGPDIWADLLFSLKEKGKKAESYENAFNGNCAGKICLNQGSRRKF